MRRLRLYADTPRRLLISACNSSKPERKSPVTTPRGKSAASQTQPTKGRKLNQRGVFMKTYGLVRFVLYVSLLLSVSQSRALLPPASPPLPNFDKRAGVQTADSVSAEQRAAVGLLRARLAAAKVDFDPIIGAPKWINATDGFLTGPNNVGDNTNRATRAFLSDYRGLFGFGPEMLD